MKENKNTIRILIALAVSLVVFNLIAFVIPFAHSASFWIAYIFGMLAILSQLAVMKLAFSGAETVKSKLYGFPVARIGLIYLAVQMAFSIAFMAVGWLIPPWIPVVLFVLFLAAAVLGLLAADTVRDEVEHQEEKFKKDVSIMRELQSRMSGLVSLAGEHEELKKELTALADELKYSDPVSSDATRAIEQDVSDRLDEMKTMMADGNNESAVSLCKKARELLAERNRLCKLNK